MTFRPFTNLGPPFSIGLAPVNADNFLYIDSNFPRYRAEKIDLYRSKYTDVCMAETGTEDGQTEAADLIETCLRNHHPDMVSNRPTCSAYMPIAAAALTVPDDLVLMRRDESGWRLVAASLCFPSSWNLAEKIGHPLEIVHGPVPMTEKMHARIRRIFDALKPKTPLWRENWSLDGDGDLRHDRLEDHRNNKREKLRGEVFLRTEYQTLHKLPTTGDILFTIGIYVTPLKELPDRPRGRAILGTLYQQYNEMSDAERSYKGINHNAGALLAWLKENGTHEDGCPSKNPR